MDIDPSKVNLNERDIEDYLFENPGQIKVYGEHPVDTWIGRQLKVPSGIIDLIGQFSGICVAVVEIKNGPIDASAIAQVCRYAHDIERIAGKKDLWGMVYKVVVGDSLSNQAFFECEAMQVTPLVFSVKLALNIGPRVWNKEFKDATERVYEAMAETDLLAPILDLRDQYHKHNREGHFRSRPGDIVDEDVKTDIQPSAVIPLLEDILGGTQVYKRDPAYADGGSEPRYRIPDEYSDIII